MTDPLPTIVDATLSGLAQAAWQSAVLAAIVLLVDVTLLRRAAARWRFALWSLVLVRLLLPALPGSPWSLFNRLNPQALAVVAAPLRGDASPSTPPTVNVSTAGKAEKITAVSLPATPVGSPFVSASAHGGWRWRDMIAAAWLAGVVLMLSRMVIGAIALRRRLRRSCGGSGFTTPAAMGRLLPASAVLVERRSTGGQAACGTPCDGRSASPVTPDVARVLTEACRQAGVRRPVRLIATDAVAGPSLMGVLRPRLLVPPALLADLSPGELRLIFLHELAHVRRCDVAGEWLMRLACAVHWFNPIAWLAAARLRQYRELAADAAVLDRGDASLAQAYGRTLLRVVERLGDARATAPSVISMAAGRRHLEWRIRMITTRPPARSFLPAALFVVVGGCTLTGARPSSPSQPAVVHAPAVAVSTEDAGAPDPALVKLLETPLPALIYNATPLDEVIESLRSASGANVFVNWHTLEVAGVRRTVPITARLRDVSLDKALDVILRDAGSGTVRLMHVAEAGVITISTRDDLEMAELRTRAYDIRDLLLHVPDFVPERALADDEVSGPTRAAIVEQIVTLIQTTIATDTWMVSGGRLGSMSEMNGTLVVRTTRSVHEQVVALLDKLRERGAVQVTIESQFVALDPQRMPNDLRAMLLPKFGHKSGAVTFLNERQVAQLMRHVAAGATDAAGAANPSKGGTALAAPRMTLFNGQRAYVTVQTLTSYVAGYELRSDGPDAPAAPTAVVKETGGGVLVDVQATVSSDRTRVTATLRPVFTSLLDLKDVPYTLLPGHPELRVQQPQVVRHRLETTVSIPDRTTAVVGGFTDEGGAGAAGATHLFLLVKPTIVLNAHVGGSAS